MVLRGEIKFARQNGRALRESGACERRVFWGGNAFACAHDLLGRAGEQPRAAAAKVGAKRALARGLAAGLTGALPRARGGGAHQSIMMRSFAGHGLRPHTLYAGPSRRRLRLPSPDLSPHRPGRHRGDPPRYLESGSDITATNTVSAATIGEHFP